MDEPETAVAAHYASGDLLDRILAALAAQGVARAEITAEHLKPVDEFHIGGVVATDRLMDGADPAPGARALDIGSGLGGTARHLARTRGVRATGVDLTPEFVDVARRLSALVGDASEFHVGSALDLPFEAASFELATLLHVGMNIADKPRLFAEAHRVLVPGGTFAVYDLMARSFDGWRFPVPWATTPAESHLGTPETYRAAAEAAGFRVEAMHDRTDIALGFFENAARQAAAKGPPPVSVAIAMGRDAPDKIANMVANLKAGRFAPTELICRKPG